jgi:ABC-2 type transport system ATP-binding protein
MVESPSPYLHLTGRENLEVHTRLLGLPRRTVTVFLSSHLLAEVEQVATHLAIISRGQLLFQGTLAYLQARKTAAVMAVVDQPQRAVELLAAAGYQATAADERISILKAASDPARISAILVHGGIAVSRLAVEQASLEDLFLDITHVQECAVR